MLRWVRNYYNAQIAGVKEQHLRYDGSMLEVELVEDAAAENRQSRRTHGLSTNTEDNDAFPIREEDNGMAQDLIPSVDNASKIHPGNISENREPQKKMGRTSSLTIPTVSDVIIRKVLLKVKKTRNMSSLRMLTSLPKGRARRSKHDDITASVVDLSGFIS